MTDTLEELTDNELHCWIRYLWHWLEAQKTAPAVFENNSHDLWKGLRWGVRAGTGDVRAEVGDLAFWG